MTLTPQQWDSLIEHPQHFDAIVANEVRQALAATQSTLGTRELTEYLYPEASARGEAVKRRNELWKAILRLGETELKANRIDLGTRTMYGKARKSYGWRSTSGDAGRYDDPIDLQRRMDKEAELSVVTPEEYHEGYNDGWSEVRHSILSDVIDKATAAMPPELLEKDLETYLEPEVMIDPDLLPVDADEAMGTFMLGESVETKKGVGLVCRVREDLDLIDVQMPDGTVNTFRAGAVTRG